MLKACKYDPSKPRFWIIQVYNTCIYQRFTFVLFEYVYLPINISVNISGMMRKDVKRLVLHQGAWWKVVKRGHLSPNQELHHLQGHFHPLPGRLNPVYFFNKKRTNNKHSGKLQCFTECKGLFNLSLNFFASWISCFIIINNYYFAVLLLDILISYVCHAMLVIFPKHKYMYEWNLCYWQTSD